jgi:hypothetical protein
VKLEPHDPEKLTHELHTAHADACACRPILNIIGEAVEK